MADPQPPTPPENSLVDQTVCGYEMIDLLGSGGMGEVYLARHVESRDLRAFKVIRADVLCQETAASRFRREAQAMSQLHHTNIVHLVDHGRMDDGALFLVMPYVKGRSLQEVVDSDGPMSVPDALVVLLQLADALQHAHDRDIVHRDLKPQNVVLHLDDPQRVRIIDFGLVKLLGAETMTQLTADDQIVGSPLYMSPEQGMTGEIGWPADVYALAGVAYYVLTGRPPFVAPSFPALIMAHCYETPERLGDRCPELQFPSGLDDLLLQCLVKDPAHRPRAKAVVNVVNLMIQQLPERPTPRTSSVARAVAPPLAAGSTPSVADQIWRDEHPEEDDSEAGRTLSALFNQITAMLIGAADAMRTEGHLDSAAAARLDHIHVMQESITNLEMDAALMDSQLEESSEPSAQELRHQLRDMRQRASNLNTQLRRELRTLYVEVINKREQVGASSSVQQLGRLDSLVETYTTLRGK
jgi:serine/threonine protein kinase